MWIEPETVGVWNKSMIITAESIIITVIQVILKRNDLVKSANVTLKCCPWTVDKLQSAGSIIVHLENLSKQACLWMFFDSHTAQVYLQCYVIQ